MCSISMFTPEEIIELAVEERIKGNVKESIRLMALAYKLQANRSLVN